MLWYKLYFSTKFIQIKPIFGYFFANFASTHTKPLKFKQTYQNRKLKPKLVTNICYKQFGTHKLNFCHFRTPKQYFFKLLHRNIWLSKITLIIKQIM